jgi:glycosyltransferase involved in cell wall biosynthesis
MKVKAIFGNWLIHQELYSHPPKGIEYGEDSKPSKNYYKNKKKNHIIGKILKKIRLPRIMPLKKVNEPLIHTSRGILPLQLFSNKPWVMDIEHVSSFTGLNEKYTKNKFTQSIIRKFTFSDKCKKIMPHTQASIESILKYNLAPIDKLEVVYPATSIPKIKIKRPSHTRLLFVASLFEDKGGTLVLKAFKELSKKYKDIELWIKSDVPQEIKKEYKNLNIKFFPYKNKILTREKLLNEFYAKSDIFIYPSMVDSFGGGLLDAMCCQLPCITSNLYAIPEIIENNKEGFIIDMEGSPKSRWIHLKNEEMAVAQIIEKTSKLIENKKLREKMGKAAYKKVESGKFSLKERDKNLLRIYKEAIK